MFGMSSFEFLVVILVAAVALGPERLPRIMRVLAKLSAEFYRLKANLQSTMRREMVNLELEEKKSGVEQAQPQPPVEEKAPPHGREV